MLDNDPINFYKYEYMLEKNETLLAQTTEQYGLYKQIPSINESNIGENNLEPHQQEIQELEQLLMSEYNIFQLIDIPIAQHDQIMTCLRKLEAIYSNDVKIEFFCRINGRVKNYYIVRGEILKKQENDYAENFVNDSEEGQSVGQPLDVQLGDNDNYQYTYWVSNNILIPNRVKLPDLTKDLENNKFKFEDVQNLQVQDHGFLLETERKYIRAKINKIVESKNQFTREINNNEELIQSQSIHSDQPRLTPMNEKTKVIKRQAQFNKDIIYQNTKNSFKRKCTEDQLEGINRKKNKDTGKRNEVNNILDSAGHETSQTIKIQPQDLLKQTIETVWALYGKDQIEKIGRSDVKRFILQVIERFEKGINLNDATLDEKIEKSTFDENGFISRKDLIKLIKALLCNELL